jgi:N-methylhydantoinase A
MLLAEPRHDFVRTYYRPLAETDFIELQRIATEMEALARERIGVADVRMRHFLEVRYVGQDFSLPIPVDPKGYGDACRTAVRERFYELHQTRFGYHDSDLALEIVNARLAAAAPSTAPALPVPPPRQDRARIGTRTVVFDAAAVDCPIFRRESLAPGERIDGPAVIQEYASTTVLFPQDRAEVAPSGELLIEVGSL